MNQTPAVPAIGATSAVQATEPLPPASRALVRDVQQAVKSLNRADYAGQGREITFSMDRLTRLPVVQVIALDTREVLSQWPSRYAIELATTYGKGTPDWPEDA